MLIDNRQQSSNDLRNYATVDTTHEQQSTHLPYLTSNTSHRQYPAYCEITKTIHQEKQQCQTNDAKVWNFMRITKTTCIQNN